MSGYIDAPVPFVKIGNRRGLTRYQIENDRQLFEFVKRFPHSFEFDPMLDVLLFIEPEVSHISAEPGIIKDSDA